MNEFRRRFFTVLYDEYNGVPDSWDVKENTVNNDFVEFNPVKMELNQGRVMYKILVEFDVETIRVMQAVADTEITNGETCFEDPEKAALYIQGLLSCSSFIKQNTVDPSSDSDSESDDDPLSELFE